MRERVEILLATYNGERFLGEQLDSILAQSHREWSLTIGDDGSSDATGEIVERYLEQNPGRIRLLDDGARGLGACRNFARLLRDADADYLMLCDQDDVWLPEKIAVTLASMKELERVHGREKALLVHTDLKVADRKLDTVAESLWKYQLTDAAGGASLNRLLLQNVATGCSVMINRPLRDLALPIPDGAVMHDWWLALVAAAFGRIGHVDQPTALYRQHGSNDTGAKKWSLCELLRPLLDAAEREKQLEINRRVGAMITRQAEAFLERYRDRLSGRQREMLEAYLRLPEAGFLMKRFHTARYGFYYSGTMRNVIRLIGM